MKNRLSDLNDHIFAQLERLGDENLAADKLDSEVKRGNAIVALSEQILRHAALQVQAAKIMSDHGIDPTSYLPRVEINVLSLTGMKQLNGAKSHG